MTSIKPYAKAVIAFIAPGVVALVAAVQDGSPGGSAVTTAEAVGIGAAMVLTAAGVYAVPNKQPVEFADSAMGETIEDEPDEVPMPPTVPALDKADAEKMLKRDLVAYVSGEPPAE